MEPGLTDEVEELRMPVFSDTTDSAVEPALKLIPSVAVAPAVAISHSWMCSLISESSLACCVIEYKLDSPLWVNAKSWLGARSMGHSVRNQPNKSSTPHFHVMIQSPRRAVILLTGSVVIQHTIQFQSYSTLNEKEIKLNSPLAA